MASKPLDLRKNKTPATPVAPVPGMPQRTPGALPLPAGAVVSLSKDERAVLEQVNWKDGDPIPTDLAEMIQAAQTEANQPLDLSDMPMVAPPQEIDIAALPAAQREALLRNVAQTIEKGRALDKVSSMLVQDPTSPDVNKTIEELARMPEGAPFRAGQTPVNVTYPAGQKAPAAAQSAPPPSPEAPAEPMRTAAPVAEFCDNCNHKIGADVIEVTDADKEAFILGLAGARFTRTYDLFNGRVRVIFRALSRHELDQAVTQAGCDDRDGLIPNQAEFFRSVQNYEFLMSVASLRVPGAAMPIEFPELDDVVTDMPAAGEKFQTKLKSYAEYVQEQIPSASLFRALQLHYMRFNQVVRRLEQNSTNPSFWDGIDS